MIQPRTFLLLLLLAAGCADGGSSTGVSAAGDTSLKSIDSSRIINQDTRLPNDSTNMGVQH